MMRVPSGGYSDPNMRRWQGEIEKKIDVLLRRLNQQPKTPPPRGGTGGWAWAESTASTNAGGWLYATTWDLSSGPQGDPVILRQNAGFWSENRLGVDRSGLYTITARIEGRFAGGAPAPTIRFHLRGVADDSPASSDRHAREIDVPIQPNGDFRASLAIAGLVDPSIYDGILPKAFLTAEYLGGFEYGPTFRVDVVRHA